MVESLVQRDVALEKRKRYLFLGVTGVGLVAGGGLSWIVGLPLLAVGAGLGLDWFRFRAKRGMRF